MLVYNPQKRAGHNRRTSPLKEEDKWRPLAGSSNNNNKHHNKESKDGGKIFNTRSFLISWYHNHRLVSSEADSEEPISIDASVPSLALLCLELIVDSIQTKLPLIEAHQLSADLRNMLLSVALSKGLLSERQIVKLMVHAEMEVLDFSHERLVYSTRPHNTTSESREISGLPSLQKFFHTKFTIVVVKC